MRHKFMTGSRKVAEFCSYPQSYGLVGTHPLDKHGDKVWSKAQETDWKIHFFISYLKQKGMSKRSDSTLML